MLNYQRVESNQEKIPCFPLFCHRLHRSCHRMQKFFRLLHKLSWFHRSCHRFHKPSNNVGIQPLRNGLPLNGELLIELYRYIYIYLIKYTYNINVHEYVYIYIYNIYIYIHLHLFLWFARAIGWIRVFSGQRAHNSLVRVTRLSFTYLFFPLMILLNPW